MASPAKHSASTGVLTVGLNGSLLLSGAGHAGTPVTLAMIANWTIESELCRNSSSVRCLAPLPRFFGEDWFDHAMALRRQYQKVTWLPFLHTYRTMCLAPQPHFRRVLEDVWAMQLAA